jgi:hypothetical protein
MGGKPFGISAITTACGPAGNNERLRADAGTVFPTPCPAVKKALSRFRELLPPEFSI